MSFVMDLVAVHTRPASQSELLLELVEEKMLLSIVPPGQDAVDKSVDSRSAAAYHLSAGGQRVRARLALQAGLAAGLTESDAISIASAVELLHNASLVHDDIQDKDEFRRGQKAVWFVFGVNTAICAGDLLLSAAYATLCDVNKPHALGPMLKLMHERIALAVDGQHGDLTAGLSTLDNRLSVSAYQTIAMNKSGALLSLPIELVLLASNKPQYLANAWQAAGAFAIGYQIVDDLCDVDSDLCAGSHKSRNNIVSVFNGSSSLADATVQAAQLGLKNIELSIALAQDLPDGIGHLLAEQGYRLRASLSATVNAGDHH
jgi:geranylgeranyl pyrophosphate synthase